MPVSTASTAARAAGRWFVNESKMNQTWWVYEADESPCPGNCCAAQSMDSDGVWRCGCGTWDVVQEAPKPTLFELRFPELAAYNGQRLWGDVWYDQEEAPRLASLSAADHAAAKAALDARLLAGQVESHLAKVASLYCDRSGKLKQEKVVLRRCKWDNHAAENGFPAGCAAHHKGKCPWVHKDQPQLLTQLQAGSAPLSQNGVRDFSALVSKPQQKQQGRW